MRTLCGHRPGQDGEVGKRLGTHAIDLVHVASALTLECEQFLTSDARQAQLAKAVGLKVESAG